MLGSARILDDSRGPDGYTQLKIHHASMGSPASLAFCALCSQPETMSSDKGCPDLLQEIVLTAFQELIAK